MKYDLKEAMRRAVANNHGDSQKAELDAFVSEMSSDRAWLSILAKAYFEQNRKKWNVSTSKIGGVVIACGKAKIDRSESVRTVQSEFGRMKQRVRAVLLDTVLPNGKKLRDATFADCAKAGGWLSAIAKMGRGNQRVGDRLAEKDVVALYQRETSRAKVA